MGSFAQWAVDNIHVVVFIIIGIATVFAIIGIYITRE